MLSSISSVIPVVLRSFSRSANPFIKNVGLLSRPFVSGRATSLLSNRFENPFYGVVAGDAVMTPKVVSVLPKVDFSSNDTNFSQSFSKLVKSYFGASTFSVPSKNLSAGRTNFSALTIVRYFSESSRSGEDTKLLQSIVKFSKAVFQLASEKLFKGQPLTKPIMFNKKDGGYSFTFSSNELSFSERRRSLDGTDLICSVRVDLKDERVFERKDLVLDTKKQRLIETLDLSERNALKLVENCLNRLNRDMVEGKISIEIPRD